MNRTMTTVLAAALFLTAGLIGCEGNPADDAQPSAAAAANPNAPSVTASATTKPGAGAGTTLLTKPFDATLGNSTSPTGIKVTPTGDLAANKPQVIVAEPAAIELGVFSTSETKPGEVTLTNTCDESVTVISAKASCGCTTSDFTPNTVLAPGDSVNVVVRLRGGPSAKKLEKNVTFKIKDYPSLKVPVRGESVSYIEMEPLRLSTSAFPGGELTLTSIDEEPFRIISVFPKVVEDIPLEAASQHEIVFDWDMFFETATNSKVTFYYDHPKCDQSMTIIQLTPEERIRLRKNATNRNAATPPKDPTNPLSPSSKPNQPTAPVVPQPPADPHRALLSHLKSGRTSAAITLIEGGKIDPNFTDAQGGPLLSVAAKDGQVAVMAALLAAGADTEITDRVGRTALMAAGQSKSVEAIRVLLDAGANVQAQDQFIGGPLAWSAGFGSAGQVQELIDAGATIDTVSLATGYTPLIWAAGFGDTDSVPLIIAAGANLEAVDSIDGATAIVWAAKTGHSAGVQALIDAGANVDARDRTGKTAFLAAAGHANGSVAKLTVLLAGGANPQMKDNTGKGALDLAKGRTDGNSQAVIEFLTEKTGG
jgi:ankyrin repeat protein